MILFPLIGWVAGTLTCREQRLATGVNGPALPSPGRGGSRPGSRPGDPTQTSPASPTSSIELEKSRSMFMLVHLLEHLGVPSGAAIAVVIVVMKFIKGGSAKIGARRDRGQRHPGEYR